MTFPAKVHFRPQRKVILPAGSMVPRRSKELHLPATLALHLSLLDTRLSQRVMNRRCLGDLHAPPEAFLQSDMVVAIHCSFALCVC